MFFLNGMNDDGVLLLLRFRFICFLESRFVIMVFLVIWIGFFSGRVIMLVFSWMFCVMVVVCVRNISGDGSLFLVVWK